MGFSVGAWAVVDRLIGTAIDNLADSERGVRPDTDQRPS